MAGLEPRESGPVRSIVMPDESPAYARAGGERDRRHGVPVPDGPANFVDPAEVRLRPSEDDREDFYHLRRVNQRRLFGAGRQTGGVIPDDRCGDRQGRQAFD